MPNKSATSVQLAALILVLAASRAIAAEPPRLAFKPAEEAGYFHFDTGTVRGKLRLDGKAQGIPELIHVPSGVEVTHGGGRAGVLSPYRVFSAGTRYTKAARDWPSTAKLLPDGAVEARFPPADDHPLEMTLVYRWTSPDTIDLETVVTPQQDMPRFEVFLSSYFADDFAVSVYVQPNRFAKDAPPCFIPGDHTPLVDGNYLMFPRDRRTVLTIFDGRWDIPPSAVQWSISRWMAAPLAIRRSSSSGITALLMAPPEDCFAVSTPYNQTPPDHVAGHASLYLSLFGGDVAAGQTVRARSRLIIAKDLTDKAAVGRYREYLKAIKH